MDLLPQVLIVDDAPDIQLIARKALEKIFSVSSALTLAEAHQHLTQHSVDLLILDVSLPDGDGIQYCEKIKKQSAHRNLPIILLTSRGELESKLNGFSAGADDYIVKPFHPSELQMRAQVRLRKRTWGLPQQQGKITFGDLEMDPSALRLKVLNPASPSESQLTSNEMGILLLLAQEDGRIVSREEIIRTIWDPKSPVSGRTVDTHICKLRKKIQNSSSTLHTVYGAGYRLVQLKDKELSSA